MKPKSLVLFGLIASCAVWLSSCTNEPVLPPHLLGVWQTSEPKFAGCWIEFSNGMLILGLTTGEEASYRINGIESERLDGGSVMYTIHYKDYEKQKSKLSFEYDPASGGTLQLKNHSEVWERAG